MRAHKVIDLNGPKTNWARVGVPARKVETLDDKSQKPAIS